MRLNSRNIICLFFFTLILSCNRKLFVDKRNVIESVKGAMVFVDRESRNYRNMNGDVFVDSLIPDFFIPYDFPEKIITRSDIDKALLSSSERRVSFFYLIRDCNNTDRASSIEIDCTTLYLDKEIDDYLHSNKIHIQPAEISFIRGDIDREYYELHKEIILHYKGKQIKLPFNTGYLDVLRTDVLEHDWK